ncbi:hypothetical protein EDC96DRAFT_522312 [Choanephora cucurbitarum]|nr:hypothetical protein EDC96DRAFT_522312 [Choanephora cucurbitarum]
MKFCNSFSSIVVVFICTLLVVSADVWSLHMTCVGDIQAKLKHENAYGTQSIVWTKNMLESKSELCSDDQIICVKDILMTMESCRRVVFDFKVKYADQWSTNNNMILYGTFLRGYGSYLAKFIPIFGS